MRAFRLGWLYFKLGSLTELQYRANFFIQVLQSAVAAGTAIVVLKLVYSHTTELNGWSEAELLVVMGIQILLGGVIRMSIQPNMERVMEEVREGKLDFALTKPEDSQVLVSVREVRIWRAVDIVSGALVLAYGVSGLERSVNVGDAALFAAIEVACKEWKHVSVQLDHSCDFQASSSNPTQCPECEWLVLGCHNRRNLGKR